MSEPTKFIRCITWKELLEKYDAAETVQERRGFIHAARSASDPDHPKEMTREDVELHSAVKFLTCIGNDVDIVEREFALRELARAVLIRDVLRERTRTMSVRLGRDILERLVRFYGLSPTHSAKLERDERARIGSILMNAREPEIGTNAPHVDPYAIIHTTIVTRLFSELTSWHALAAIPQLHAHLAALAYGDTWQTKHHHALALTWDGWEQLPMSHPPRKYGPIHAALEDPTVRAAVERDYHRILMACGDAERASCDGEQAARTQLVLLAQFVALYQNAVCPAMKPKTKHGPKH